MRSEMSSNKRTKAISSLPILFKVALLLVCFPVSMFAQTPGASQGTIQGVVSDEQGAKIARAEVRLRSREGVQLTTRSDQNGAFVFTNLKPGEYLIAIKAPGFSDFVSTDIRLESGQGEQVNLQLKVAAINESVVVTATGTAQRADEVSKVVSILDRQQIEDGHKYDLGETLRGVPGLRVQKQGSPGALTSLRLRGQRTSDTSLLFDGLRVRDASDINGSAVSLTSDLVPLSIDRVEILRGSGSSIYGTNAIGGVVNFVTTPSDEGTHFLFGAEGGGLKSFRERLEGSGGYKSFGFNAGVNRIDVRRGVDGEDQYGNTVASGRLQFDINPSTAIVVHGYGTFANARLNDSPFALPAAFGTGQPFPRAVAGQNFEPDFNNPDQGRRNRLLVGSARLTQRISESVSYSVAYQRVSSNRRNYNGPAIDPQFASFYPFGDFEFVNVNKGITDTFDARVNLTLGRSNFATIGVEAENESLFQQSNPSFSAFNNTTDKQRTFAIFGQDQMSFFQNRLQLSLGIRGQFYRLRAADRPGVLGNIDVKSSVTGDGAIAYFFRSTNTKLRAHAGNGFRAPSLFERFGAGTISGAGFVRFGDPTLKAEQSISVDAGIDQRLANDRVLLGATWFYTRLQRTIAFTSFFNDPLGAGRFNGYTNLPGGLSRGLETFVEANPRRGTSIRGSYTFTNSDRALAGGGLQPEYVIPKHLFALNLNQRVGPFVLNFDLNHTGAYIAPVFENNFPFRMAELTFSGYTKADVFGSFQKRLSEKWTATFFGGAENVFNQRYYENGFFAPGIVGRAGVNFKF